ncbi:hypothetical protein AGMMS50212_04710 [Spirochaetia bacterium]|nr:hypothetical protein AGMMS50212_04710 [Spirochaetia bacterium]
MPLITFNIGEIENLGATVTVPDGTALLEAARSAGIEIESPCGGNGTCGKCTVKIAKNSASEFTEVQACQIKVEDDTYVLIRDYQNENRSMRILSQGKNFSYDLDPFIKKEPPCYGIVIDIGTTTLVSTLVDLNTGKTLASESALNPQVRYAQDVVSRIQFASTADGLHTMRSCLVETITGMIAKITDAAAADTTAESTEINRLKIYEVVYSGNTVMLHIAVGVDPSPLGQAPYTPKIWGGSHVEAPDLGLAHEALVYLPPIISGYVGADITSGILAAGLAERKGVTVFIDIGTNGEIVVSRNGVLAASSTAAGPCFEGMNISCGMRAMNGAVESFKIDDGGNIHFSVIGGGTAQGICGSGLLDITAELVRTGIIEESGRFSKIYPINEKDGTGAFPITENIYLSQRDVRQVQLAKGAVRCGIEMLLDTLNVSSEEVDSVIIAGSFGYHLNENSLINLGLLPDSFAGKVEFAGNTSLSGGTALLLNAGLRKKMEALVKKIEKVELADDPMFEENFVHYMGF